MAVTIKMRSPRYPTIGLGEAIERVRAVYEKDHLNTIPKEVVAEHMGYKTLNGASLGVISAVSKYGLLTGGSDAMRVSDRALVILAHEKGDQGRAEAIHEASRSPALFEELFSEFPSGASDNAIKSFLLGRKKFLPTAVPVAIRAFKETLQVVHEEPTFGDGEALDAPTGSSSTHLAEDAPATRNSANSGRPAQTAMQVGGFEIGFTGQAIRLMGNIGSQEEAEKVLKAIEGLKFMLPEKSGD